MSRRVGVAAGVCGGVVSDGRLSLSGYFRMGQFILAEGNADERLLQSAWTRQPVRRFYPRKWTEGDRRKVLVEAGVWLSTWWISRG